MLEGFEVYSLSTGMASITLSKNGVGFSKSAVAKMGKCQGNCACIFMKGLEQRGIQHRIETKFDSSPSLS